MLLTVTEFKTIILSLYCFSSYHRTQADEASAKNVSTSYLVHMDMSQTSREEIAKQLQLLAEQEAKFIAEIK